MVEEKNIVVLICKDYPYDTILKARTVLDLPPARGALSGENLSLSVDTQRGCWDIGDKNPITFHTLLNIGEVYSFKKRTNNVNANYLIGVYDRTNTRHLQLLANNIVRMERENADKHLRPQLEHK